MSGADLREWSYANSEIADSATVPSGRGVGGVGGQSVQTKHYSIPEMTEYNREVLGEENKGKRSSGKKIMRRGGRGGLFWCSHHQMGEQPQLCFCEHVFFPPLHIAGSGLCVCLRSAVQRGVRQNQHDSEGSCHEGWKLRSDRKVHDEKSKVQTTRTTDKPSLHFLPLYKDEAKKS